MTFPPDYSERVYAGVLGKIIGVYLGRPFEGWTHEQIMASLGEIKYYVNDRRDLPLRNHQLVVTDDDISGTFTFLRALPDYDNSLDLTPDLFGNHFPIQGQGARLRRWNALFESQKCGVLCGVSQSAPPQDGSIFDDGIEPGLADLSGG